MQFHITTIEIWCWQGFQKVLLWLIYASSWVIVSLRTEYIRTWIHYIHTWNAATALIVRIALNVRTWRTIVRALHVTLSPRYITLLFIHVTLFRVVDSTICVIVSPSYVTLLFIHVMASLLYVTVLTLHVTESSFRA